ncbi:MAG: hypothetical protein WDO74_23480 [Pseudomonadota bacterium]
MTPAVKEALERVDDRERKVKRAASDQEREYELCLLDGAKRRVE